jgi:putative transposase
MAGLCREFGISRKTGYKIFTRYNEIGLEGRTTLVGDASRLAGRRSRQLPSPMAIAIRRR